MLDPKVATILSSLKAPIAAKPTKTPIAPAPRAKSPTTPGLGAKMREETSHSLEKLLKQGSFTTGLENLVKMAKGPVPAAPPSQVLSKNITRGLQPSAHPLDHVVGSDAPDMMAPKPQQPMSMERAHADLAHLRGDPQKAMGVIGLPEAGAMRGAPPKAALGGGGKAPPARTPPAGGGGGGGGMLGGLKMPRMGRTMGLMGAGAAGAALYGMHHQNEEDRQQRSLVYAPMPGSLMQ
jgi:hypothetical protein